VTLRFTGHAVLRNQYGDVDCTVPYTINLLLLLLILLLMLVCSQLSPLKVEVFRWVSKFDSIEDYIETNSGCHSVLLFPTLFGLRLAEDFEFGTRFDW